MAIINKLPDETIRLIAAGEVITRPTNVIKELLENSLDAGATNIRITVHQAGLKLIEIVDNGHGIARSNAKLLCHRYATSKLNTADDLNRISTFGFRGEALASVSEMAHVDVRTFNQQFDTTGWEATYNYGELVAKPIDKYVPIPGTQLRVTNLFSHVKHRLSSTVSRLADEKRSISDLVMRYAIHHRDRVTMVLKDSQFSSDLICSLAPMETKPCIGSFFGHDMEENLVEFCINGESQNFVVEARIVYSFKNQTSSSQRSIFILFVNDRLVECNDMKRELDGLINEFIKAKQQVPLLYISLKVPPSDIDVNTHPAKTTVALHYQSEITSLILNTMRERLSAIRSAGGPKLMRSLDTNQVLGSPCFQKSNLNNDQSAMSPRPTNGSLKTNGISTATTPTNVLPYNRVHNDSSQPTIDQITQISNKRCRIRRDMNLLSISQLKDLVAKEARTCEASHLIKNSVFVGVFDHYHALIQNGTKLFSINLKNFLREMIYQFYLYDFGNFPPIEVLPPGNKIKFIIGTYLDDIKKHEPGCFASLKYNTPESVVAELLDHQTMLEDYLTLKFTEEAIMTIPNVMPDEIPNLVFLGRFLSDLVNVVEYKSETKCFQMIGRVIADFYSEPPANLRDRQVHKKYHDLVDRKLYYSIKNYLLIPEWLFSVENISQISDTKDLYKVFERC